MSRCTAYPAWPNTSCTRTTTWSSVGRWPGEFFSPEGSQFIEGRRAGQTDDPGDHHDHSEQTEVGAQSVRGELLSEHDQAEHHGDDGFAGHHRRVGGLQRARRERTLLGRDGAEGRQHTEVERGRPEQRHRAVEHRRQRVDLHGHDPEQRPGNRAEQQAGDVARSPSRGQKGDQHCQQNREQDDVDHPQLPPVPRRDRTREHDEHGHPEGDAAISPICRPVGDRRVQRAGTTSSNGTDKTINGCTSSTVPTTSAATCSPKAPTETTAPISHRRSMPPRARDLRGSRAHHREQGRQ